MTTAFALALASLLTVGPSVYAQEVPEDPTDELPEAPPSSVLVEQFTVSATSDSGTDTTEPLVAGQTYVVEATGVVGFGGGDADAECASFDGDPTYEREHFPSAPHTADLVIDKTGLEWVAETPDAGNCNTADHTYRTHLVPEATKRFNFLFNDTGWRGDNSGQLTVTIFLTDQVAPAGSDPINEFSFSASSPGGADSPVVLAGDRSYRVEVSGRYTVGQAGTTHDAECYQTAVPGTEERAPGQRYDQLDETGSTVEVLLAGAEVDWVPSRGRTGCDDRNHRYVIEIVGPGAPINLRVRDDWYGDNVGLVTVRIYDLGPAETSPEGDGDGTGVPTVPGVSDTLDAARNGAVFVEEVSVDSRSSSGTTTATTLVPGQIYVFEASGIVQFGNGRADAECAAFDLLPTFKREYFPDTPDTADIWVDGKGREWTATVPDAEGCNTSDHTYTFFLVPQTAKRVNLLFADGAWRGDNSGLFTVRIFVTDKVPPAGDQIAHFGFAASDSNGATSPQGDGQELIATRSYRVQASGVFEYTPGSQSDPECAQLVPGAPGDRQDTFDDAGSTPDVLFRQQEVDWVPMQGRTGCDDRSHAYFIEVSGISGTVNLRVRDGWYGDNSGFVEVKIFDLGPASGSGSDTLPVGTPDETLDPPSTSPDAVLVSQFTVDAASAGGTDSTVPLAAGETYVVEASGLVRFGAGNADAECANFDTDPIYKREWFPSAPDTADLIIDGTGREWAAVTPDGQGCNTDDHRYTLFLVPETSKRFNFRFNDTGSRHDNSGSLTVRVFLVDEVAPAGGTIRAALSVSAADQSGETSSFQLSSSQTYRIRATGTFTVDGGGTAYDAECGSTAGAPGDRQEVFDAAGSSPDLVVNDIEVDWVPTKGRTGCNDDTHTYILELSGVSGPLTFRVRDSWYGDNVGQVDVEIIELASA